MITELNVVMNVLAYGLRPRPTTMYLTEHGPGVVRQLLRVGIPAAKQILECLVGEDFNSPLLGIGHNWVRFAGVSNDEFIVKLKQSGGATKRVQRLPKVSLKSRGCKYSAKIRFHPR